MRCGYGFESCDANCPRNVKNTNIAKHRPIFLPPLLLVSSKELVLKVPKRGQFDSCDKKTLRFVCPSCTRDTDGIAAKLLRCGIASEALRRNMQLSPKPVLKLFSDLCSCSFPFSGGGRNLYFSCVGPEARTSEALPADVPSVSCCLTL